jgi:glycosyltransferase involved in cell wall biosynthesis
MKIAILGTRGIPARYGGFETLADQLATRLVQRGHQVTVYCRKPFVTANDDFDPRIRRIILPTISNKYFDTLFHTFLSVLHVLSSDAEALLICNVANSPVTWIPRLVGKPTALNVDGLDRQRRKWNFLGQWFLYFCEMLAVFTPTRLVTDAATIRDYFRKRYHKTSEMIAYGAEPIRTHSSEVSDFGLSSRRYILYVARLEPENNPELVIRAYRDVDTDWPLAVVGGNPYRPGYVQLLKSMADKRVIFTGPIYGGDYWKLQNNAGLFVFAGEIGGVHPALVEAMAAPNAILYLDTPTNHETTGGCGISFRPEQHELAEKLSQLIASPEQINQLRERAQNFARENYNWEKIVDQYERLFEGILR